MRYENLLLCDNGGFRTPGSTLLVREPGRRLAMFWRLHTATAHIILVSHLNCRWILLILRGCVRHRTILPFMTTPGALSSSPRRIKDGSFSLSDHMLVVTIRYDGSNSEIDLKEEDRRT
jgi:hypothetical protein